MVVGKGYDGWGLWWWEGCVRWESKIERRNDGGGKEVFDVVERHKDFGN